MPSVHFYEKGRSYVQGRNNSQAIVTFRELLNKYPESPVSRKAAAEIGLLYYQNDDYNRAIEAYKSLSPNIRAAKKHVLPCAI